MRATRWACLTTIMAIVVGVYSDQESGSEVVYDDTDAGGSPFESMRMTRGRASGYVDAVEVERSFLREERKRIRAERRRLKKERREERLAESQREPGTSSSIPVPVGSAGGAEDVSQPTRHLREHTSFLDHSGPSSAVDYPGGESTPEVVDLEWVRANLSSLWSVVRALSRQQGRPFINRGSRGRHHHSGVVAPPSTGACPGGDDACRRAGGEICGGQGSCSCGHCFCNPGYYGTFCQCDDHSCPVYDGMACGGPSRGQCRCGGCVCRPGYAGESCDCPTNTQLCVSPENDEICSSKGSCECGRCRCSDGHKGLYCEDTVYAAGVCEKLKSCVMCRAWNRDLPSCANCQITVTTVETLEPSMTTCVLVNSGCLLQFSYIPQTAEAYTVLVPRDMVCPES